MIGHFADAFAHCIERRGLIGLREGGQGNSRSSEKFAAGQIVVGHKMFLLLERRGINRRRGMFLDDFGIEFETQARFHWHSYDVTFTRVTAPVIPMPTSVTVPAPTPALAPRPLIGARGVWLLASGALLLLAAAALVWAFKNPARSVAAPLPTELQTFWQPYLNADKPTLIVYSTPLFVRLDHFLYRDPQMNHAQDIEKDQKTGKVIEVLETTSKRAAYKYTGVGEVEGIFLLTQLLSARQVPLSIKRSSNVSWEDLKGRQIVLLGSPKNTPLLQHLPYQPKFETAPDRIVNRLPAAGEPREYPNVHKEPFGEAVEAYTLVSFYQGLDSNTRLLMLSCVTNEGIAGAAEYITRADKLQELFQQMKLRPDDALPAAFQFIVKVRLNDRVPVQVSYVTHHLLTK
jgi:hypothetical protein